MIEINNIAKNFGTVQAVRAVSFTAEDGMITTLLGANGSGKSTTLRAVAGLLKPTKGTVTVDGIDVTQNPLAAQARLGVFPDQFGLYTRLTTREHIGYFAELQGLRGTERDKAVEEVTRLLHMEDILDRRTEGFSQGQRMKVALAGAIVHRPKNIVLDEPTRGLDVMSIRLLREILLGLKAEGHCVLLSSHVMAEVEVLSDHVVMVAEGVVCADGSPKSLVEASKQPNLEEAFVALTNAAISTGKTERNVA
ncbi:ATP-binding cassette domain-containing protein [Kordiimonas gwangyangensis]|uniref:ABC transporter ATP-binding protein n=1 Tax=Kordiimonas gwangyangensis TaxID=288022 RepID=UPI00037EA79E|nr:ATP-binding cassette domain-containing protein [Kordiimonas gwangyangensis]